MKAILMLEDGISFYGESQGVKGKSIGELILNTAVVGYQEMMTDPANAGKILVLTYPLIGNYGCAPKFNESKKVWLCGLAIKEKTRIFSNWQAKESFDNFLEGHSLPMISEVDTRTLAVHLRKKGELWGIISTDTFSSEELLYKINDFRKKKTASRLPEISVQQPLNIGKAKAKKRIAILDLGITNSIIRQLEALGCALTIFPYNTTAEEILRLKPAGLIISNGPEEDAELKEAVNNVKDLLGRLPILGISTGHQVLAKALGAKLSRMPLGHRGVNYPIGNPGSHKGEITVQNHSWVVEKNSLEKIKDVKITAFNINDKTVEEMESKRRKFIGIQYYSASPGLNEVNCVFTKFMKLLTRE